LDPTFGTAGFASIEEIANAVVLQPDGRIVVAGSAQTADGDVFAVARFLADNAGTPNQRFVEQLYWDLLRRPVDSSGLTSWTGLLDQGLSRTQVATAIQSSGEYHTLVVGDMYQLVLGRIVDPSGLTAWVSFLNQGGTAEQLEAILLGSDEFFAVHGSDNNQGFLPALYQIVLQRPIDSSGAQSWGQAHGVSNEQVGDVLMSSAEYFARV
jgi:hypothetical protein